jgi:hypothetical protein
MAAVVVLAVLALVLSQAPANDAPLISSAAPYEVVEAQPPPCPPPGAVPLERDLTVAYPQRTYLLADGRVCRPDPAGRSADAR